LLAILIWLVAFQLQSVWGRGELSGISGAAVAANVGVWIGLRGLLGLYPGYGLAPADELRRQTYAVAATLAIISVFALASHTGDSLSRALLIPGFLGLVILPPLMRSFAKRGMMRAGVWGKPVVILGAHKSGERLIKALQKERGLGYIPVAVFDNRLAPASGVLEDVPYGGTMTDAVRLAQKGMVDSIMVSMPDSRRKNSTAYLSRVNANFRYVIIVPDLGGVATSAVLARDLGGILGIEAKQNLLDPWPQRIKRAFELVGVLAGGLLISPFLLVLAVLIEFDSPGPSLYTQLRLGRGGKHFQCWKFRTMHVDAERLLTEHLESNGELRKEWEQNHKLRNDPRITRIGRLLRATSLDELPQLWNVVRGEMSLVGPRPIVDAEVPRYGNVYKMYRKVTPGITGLWQVSGRTDTGYEERVAFDAYYIRNWSIWLDLVILARTIGSVVLGRGAF
jgi:Undecaprenyl-phosphate galactose phosphotransferase WbaP